MKTADEVLAELLAQLDDFRIDDWTVETLRSVAVHVTENGA